MYSPPKHTFFSDRDNLKSTPPMPIKGAKKSKVVKGKVDETKRDEEEAHYLRQLRVDHTLRACKNGTFERLTNDYRPRDDDDLNYKVTEHLTLLSYLFLSITTPGDDYAKAILHAATIDYETTINAIEKYNGNDFQRILLKVSLLRKIKAKFDDMGENTLPFKFDEPEFNEENTQQVNINDRKLTSTTNENVEPNSANTTSLITHEQESSRYKAHINSCKGNDELTFAFDEPEFNEENTPPAAARRSC